MLRNKEAYILDNKKKWRLNNNDLFDRVINLKMTTDRGETYVIRSDFEVVYKNLQVTRIYADDILSNANYYVRKCTYKPSINVQYTRTNDETNTNIDIYISNFYMLSSDGNTVLSFSDATKKLVSVDIMMGYYGQFAARYNYNLKNINFKDLQSFTPGFGVDVIKANVLFTATEKMPPDSTLHIRCEIGSSLSPEVGSIENKTYDEITGDGLIINPKVLVGKSYLEQVMYKYITKRFLKNTWDPAGGVTFISTGKAEFMSDIDAAKYGTQIFCSEGVKKISEDRMVDILDANDVAIPRDTYFSSGVDAINTFNNINTAIGNDLLRTQLNNNNWLVYTVDESIKVDDISELFDYKLDKESQGAEYYNYTLPAVYNINIGSMSTISAPFFFFVNPFDIIHFQSKYKTTSLVQYFANGREGDYIVIKQQVSFATVDDLNEMTLLCTTKAKEKEDGE